MSREDLVKRRVELNRLIRRACLERNCIPILCGKPWAVSWRGQFTKPIDSRIRKWRRELANIKRWIGPPPKLFKKRPLGGEARIQRQYGHGRGTGRLIAA